MSRIAKIPVKIPAGVTVQVSPANEVTVKGPKGELSLAVDRDIQVLVQSGEIVVKRPTDQIRHKELHGTYRALLANMVKGVTEGFRKELELVGVGYRATAQGQLLDITVGYSHNILMEIPKEVKVKTEAEKGQNPKIVLESADKQLLGAVAAKIRSLRKPEPYKGKGIRYADEIVRRKAGKSAGK
ncbi:MAG: 50S ribosomal protein L6 [Thermoflavifilum sp.]|nr:50S ribosomal protein L6 [Thermoflavifilum sp.]